MGDSSDSVTELQERLRLLLAENDALAERAEDNLLLGLIAEKIGRTEEMGELLAIGLEQTSILKDLPLATYWEVHAGQATLGASYCSCEAGPSEPQRWMLPAGLVAALREGAFLIQQVGREDFGLAEALRFCKVVLRQALVIPIRFTTGGAGVFVFGDGQAEARLDALRGLLVRSVEMIAARYDNIRLMTDLRGLNASLDRRVEERTEALIRANARLELEVAERQTTELALALSVQRFRQAFAEGPLGMALTDLQERFLEVNRAFCTLTGYSSEELRALAITDVTHPEDRPISGSVYREALESGRSGYTLEKRFQRKDGSLVWGRVTATILRDPEGQPTLRLGMVEDISARKAVEQERQLLQEQLIQAQKMESVGRLAGGVAHDFNNLLTAILGNTELALADCDAPTRPDLVEALQEIQSAGRRAAELTRQLLAFSRKQILRKQRLDLNEAIRGFGRMLKRLISESIEIRFVLAPDLGDLFADPTQIEQVLLNLALNARDAMPEGGQLTIATAKTTVGSTLDSERPEMPPGDYVVLSVSDTGCGMDGETVERIFEPFFTTKAVGRGTGLGLATVYGIIRQHDGHVRCQSQPGRGTTFEVYLEQRADGEAAAVEEVEAPEAAGGSETILLVEDDTSVRQLTGRILRRLGYQVVEAADAATAVEWAARHPRLDLLFTDVVMPQLNGRQVADRVRTAHPGVRVVFASGYADEVLAGHGALDPGTSFIQKPFTSQSLAQVVRRALGEKPNGTDGGDDSDVTRPRRDSRPGT